MSLRGSALCALTAAVAILVSLAMPRAAAQQEAELQLGVGVGGISAPAYRGSRDRIGLALPVPYIVYRSPRVRVDRDGARGIIYADPVMEVGFSVGVSLPVRADAAEVRAGMPALNPLVEIGPAVNIQLARDTRYSLNLQLPVRAAVELDLSAPRNAGWLFNPALRYRCRVRAWPANVSLRLGVLYAERSYHGYFYDVDEQFASIGRPAYRAPGGYSGYSLSANLRRLIDRRWWWGIFARYDSVRGSVFDDSPLVTAQDGVMVGAAVAWIFHSSGGR